MELRNRRVVVLGGGRSGLASVRLLVREGADVTLAERAPTEALRQELEALGVALATSEALPDGGYDLCITSPGFALEHPWITACQARGLPIHSEIDLAASYFKGRAVAVTGSKGKSSVVKLIADALNASGVEAVACGNYGYPFSQVVLDHPCAVAVVEISTFQMEHTHQFAPEAAVILNIQPEHLDRHGSMAVYAALKEKLLEQMPPSALKLRPQDLRTSTIDAQGSYFGNAILTPALSAAEQILRHLGLTSNAIKRAVQAFEPLPHRHQLITTCHGIKFIDDSKATSLSALMAGIEMTPGRIRLIAGGLPKENDFTPAKKLLSLRVEKVYLIGKSARAMATAWQETVPCQQAGTLDHAVASAWTDAQPGDTILLSPGTASFDQFNSYSERGERFAQQVRAITASPQKGEGDVHES